MHMKSPRPALAPIALAVHLACAATFGVAAPAVALADSNVASSQQYSIAAGPLGASLNRFAQQSGVAIIFEAQGVAGKTSPGLNGHYTVAEGFATLLRGSGFSAQQSGNGYVLLPVAKDASAVELGPTSVTSSGLGSTTEGTGSYTTAATATATRLPLSIRETPQSVSVITRQQMDDQNITSIASALERSVGITLGGSETDRVTPRSRGFTINKIQYDGIPTVEDNRFDTDFLSDTAIYDRVEIVRGATGLLTGTGEPRQPST